MVWRWPELLINLDRDVFVFPILGRQFQRDDGHVQGEHRHPASGVSLLERVAGWQRMGAVEHRDVVQPQKAALEHVVAVAVLAVDPPGVVEQQLVKHSLQEVQIALAALHPFRPEHFQSTIA